MMIEIRIVYAFVEIYTENRDKGSFYIELEGGCGYTHKTNSLS